MLRGSVHVPHPAVSTSLISPAARITHNHTLPIFQRRRRRKRACQLQRLRRPCTRQGIGYRYSGSRTTPAKHHQQRRGQTRVSSPKVSRRTLKHAALVDGWHDLANGVKSTGVWHAWRHRGKDTVCATHKEAGSTRNRYHIAAAANKGSGIQREEMNKCAEETSVRAPAAVQDSVQALSGSEYSLFNELLGAPPFLVALLQI